MTATTHALVGGIIAATVPNPALGLSLALISHPILDIIPHWDFGWGWRKKSKSKLLIESSLDLLFGIVVSFVLFGQHVALWYFLAAVILSEIWDLLEAPYWFFQWKFFPFGFIYKFQSGLQGKLKLPGGVITQLVSVAGIFLILQFLQIRYQI